MVAASEFHPEMKSQPSESNLRTNGFDQQSHLEYRNWLFHAEDSLKITDSWIPNFQTKILDILGICSHYPRRHGKSWEYADGWQVAIRRRRQIKAVDEAHNATPVRDPRDPQYLQPVNGGFLKWGTHHPYHHPGLTLGVAIF